MSISNCRQPHPLCILANLKRDWLAHKASADHSYTDGIALFFSFRQCFIDQNHTESLLKSG
ncbi:MAG: hypothetical protein ACD_65C00255G0001 [uncultured bacterium]|nr:MAG: hypothetical protein ACD_65C00255G0001 [uncultured bacterium]